MASAGLTDVRVVAAAGEGSVRVRGIDAHGSTTQTIDDLVVDSDMIILVGSDLPEVPLAFVSVIADAARKSGNLLAGVLVDQKGWESPQGAKALALLRTELDMLVSVNQVAPATGFVDVLKGGRREEGHCAPVASAGRD